MSWLSFSFTMVWLCFISTIHQKKYKVSILMITTTIVHYDIFIEPLALKVVKKIGMTNEQIRLIHNSTKEMLSAADLWDFDNRQIVGAAFADAAKRTVTESEKKPWNVVICRTLSCYWIIPQCNDQKHVHFTFAGFSILMYVCN